MNIYRANRTWITFLLLGLIVFLAETTIMLLLSNIRIEEYDFLHLAVLDSLLLLAIIFPAFHILIFRPMHQRILELKEARNEIRLKNRELSLMVAQNAQILEAAEEGILGLDQHGMTIFSNPAAERILGWSGDELMGKDHHGLIHHAFCGGKDKGGKCPARQCVSTGEVFHQVEAKLRRKDGGSFPAEISCSPIKDGHEVVGAVLTFRDITERKKTEEKLKCLAYFDVLTGLPNRMCLQERFQHLSAHARRAHKRAAVMFLDLDDFKIINDEHGHATGDAYLKEIADRIHGVIRETDVVARVGGDEFVWAGIVRGKRDAALIARKILAALSSSISAEGNTFRVSASIGIAIGERDGNSLRELLKAADSAMYLAKERGKNSFFFSEHQDEEETTLEAPAV